MNLNEFDIDYETPVPDIRGRHVLCRLSGGAASAVATMRCIEWYGRERVSVVNADTGCESPDNYALVDAVEKQSGVEVVRLSQGKNIWDVFDKHGVMRIVRGGGACKASVELKQKPLDEYTKANYLPNDVVIAMGMTWMEPERQERLARRLEPYKVLYPLNVKPRLSECQIQAELERYGLPISEAYKQGYPHDNCNGGCVLAGAQQWAGLLRDNPAWFAYCEMREWKFHEKTGFAALRDRRGGDTKAYPLRQLRIDIENGRTFSDKWRSTCGCMLLGEDGE